MTIPIDWNIKALKALNDNADFTKENGNIVSRGFILYCDRIAFDFGLCRSELGWKQYDTDQDFSGFGVWYHEQKQAVFTFCEGDMTLVMCQTEEGWREELAEMDAFYKE